MAAIKYIPSSDPFGYYGLDAWRQLKAAHDASGHLETTPETFKTILNRLKTYAQDNHPEWRIRSRSAFNAIGLRRAGEKHPTST